VKRAALPLLLLGLFLFSPLRSLRVVAALVLLAIALSELACRLLPRLVAVRRDGETTRVNRFEPLTVRLSVVNRSLLPVRAVLVSDEPGGLRPTSATAFLVSLGPRERRVLAWTAEAHERGEFHAGPVTVSGPGPLGLRPWQRTVKAPLRVIAYPATRPLSLVHRRGLASGAIASASRLDEDVTRYRSLREYVPGDEPRRISWKVSARLGALYSVEYAPSLTVPALVLLDLVEPHYPVARRQPMIERAVEMAASLVTHFAGIKQPVGLVAAAAIPGREGFPALPLRVGPGHAVAILETLALVRSRAESVDLARLTMQAGFPVPAGTLLCVVAPPLAAEDRAGLRGLRRRGIALEAFVVTSSATRAGDARLDGALSHAVAEHGELLDG
jgi:uncharacterized protein (DUF58 family)